MKVVLTFRIGKFMSSNVVFFIQGLQKMICARVGIRLVPAQMSKIRGRKMTFLRILKMTKFLPGQLLLASRASKLFNFLLKMARRAGMLSFLALE